MYCKECGKSIDADSKYCSYCGAKQQGASINYERESKVEISGNINAKLSPSFPSISNFVKNHILISIIYSLWFLINLILLISGSGHPHFWPYVHKSGGYYDKFYLGGTYIKENTNFDWSLKYYGWPEFIIYVFIIPIVVFSIYTLYKRFEKNQSKAFLTPPNIYKK